jgi:hypothetical protein
MSALNLAEIEPARRAAVAQDAIHAARQQWSREHRRPKALTAREALLALQFEALFVWQAAHTLAAGNALSGDDLSRLTVACKRIDSISEECA